MQIGAWNDFGGLCRIVNLKSLPVSLLIPTFQLLILFQFKFLNSLTVSHEIIVLGIMGELCMDKPSVPGRKTWGVVQSRVEYFLIVSL